MPPQVERARARASGSESRIDGHLGACAAASAADGSIWRDVGATAEAIGHVSRPTRSAGRSSVDGMHALAACLADVYAAPPPDPFGELRSASRGPRWSALAQARRRDGRPAALLPMPVADCSTTGSKATRSRARSAPTGVLNLLQGPRSGGTAFNFLHHHVGSPAGVFRPPRSNAHDVLRALPGLRVRDGGCDAHHHARRSRGRRRARERRESSRPIVLSRASIRGGR